MVDDAPREAGDSTASGPTTSTTSSGACSPVTGTATTWTIEGTAEELAATLRRGWLYTGQHSAHRRRRARHRSRPRCRCARAVVCVQNHDQIGNRALGDRLHPPRIPPRGGRPSVLLTAPMTPLLFMGQEWAASAPFQFFTDFEPELGRRSSKAGAASSAPSPSSRRGRAARAIPAPQSPDTFAASRLRWDEQHGCHACRECLRFYRALLRLRRCESGARSQRCVRVRRVRPQTTDAVVLRRARALTSCSSAVRLRGSRAVDVGASRGTMQVRAALQLVLDTERPAPAGGRHGAASPNRRARPAVVRFSAPGGAVISGLRHRRVMDSAAFRPGEHLPAADPRRVHA